MLISSPTDPAANSFTSRAWADAYFADRLYSEAWLDADNSQKDGALVLATSLLSRLPWDGYQLSTTQPLPFPRYGLLEDGVLYRMATTSDFPTRLKAATAETALALLAAGVRPGTPTEAEAAGLKRLKVGSVELEFTGGSGLEPASGIPPEAFALIGGWLAGGPRGLARPLVRA